jgi:hypothetical protein
MFAQLQGYFEVVCHKAIGKQAENGSEVVSLTNRRLARRRRRSKSELTIPERALAAAASLQGRLRAINKRRG